MNLYEFEGKQLFAKHGILTPKGVVARRGDDYAAKYRELGLPEVVAKAQVLSGKRGKNNGIRFCSSAEEVRAACEDLFAMQIRGQLVAAVLIEEKLAISEEHYISITYDTNKKQPVMIYSQDGGMDIEAVPEEKIDKTWLDIRGAELPPSIGESLWQCFLAEDTRLAEINPLVKTTDGRWVAADAKVALDDDAFYRHKEWETLEPRTLLGRLPTEREVAVKKIDEGEGYYRGTAGKYIEMDGDMAILFSGGGASIANMDALLKAGLEPANYTEYSGNPPREKVYQLAKIVLSKPGLHGLWIAGGVANFTNVAETFQGIADALDEVKPTYPIVVRRAGPNEGEGMRLMRDCAERNGLTMKLFGKDTSMGETAVTLATLVKEKAYASAP
ncbi:MAG: Succinyl-CoA synthetase, beta subunit [Candidatus Magasanikbacteria bacterium GW2011_GWA2_56_11]|uniref:Succinyl-CoA synthetase, beta subunit n=1 Tax=Candidatus Magasanikbacteria bacterium GW2011_GWA2_56_11 TaxID=1619044 RepID=A0A0G1YHB4_9BACT|nr:MAG: Succinyl-CoA synthetase, beta subunit [Candidatus Magasanikbacteria bacterium GW2011_GWA2_56_11]